MGHIRIVQETQPNEVYDLDAQSQVQVSVESAGHAADALGISRLLEALRIVGLALRELAGLVRRAVGDEGVVEWDASKPDGTPRRLVDVSRLRSLGWASTVELEDGVRRTYQRYLANRA